MAIFRDNYNIENLIEEGAELFAPIPLEEGAKSSVRAGFDPEKHASQLMNHELWKKNHYSYGVKAAQKRKDKGTYDSELGKKAGANLSKLGDFRLGTKLNAAEHRAVGEHIARHIENDIGYKKEARLQHDTMNREPNGKKMTEATDEENYHVDSPFNSRMTPAEKAAGARRNAGHAHVAKLKQVTRVNKGTYGTAIIDHDDEHHAGEPNKNPSFAGANEAMKAFGLTVRGTDAKRTPVRPKGKAATPEAMKAYRAALRKQVKEETEQLDEVSLAAMGHAAEREYAEGRDGGGGAPKKVRKIAVMHPKQGHVRSYDETPEGMAKAKAHAVKLGGTIKRVTEDTEFDLIIVKEGLSYYYNLSIDDEDIQEGIGITEQGIINEVSRLLQNSIVEDIDVNSIKGIVEKYNSRKMQKESNK